MTDEVVGVIVLVVMVVAACLVFSRVGIVGPTALDPPKPTRPQGRPEPPEEADLVGLWRFFGPVAMMGASGCGVVVVSTFLPYSLVLPRALVVVWSVVLFPVMFLFVGTVSQMRRKRRNVLSRIEAAAPAAWPLAALLIAVFAVAGLTGATGPSGDAEIRDGRYVLTYRGVVTEIISRDEYERYETLERRLIAGGTGALYAPGIALGLYARKRPRQHP
jgi:hypothetical protein